MVTGTVGFATYGFASSGTYFICGIPFIALWSMGHSGAQSLMTAQISPSDQGKLQGALSSLRGVVGMVGPILFTQSFALGLRLKPEISGAPYLLASAMVFMALVISRQTKSPAA